jgi:hypothetical protein
MGGPVVKKTILIALVAAVVALCAGSGVAHSGFSLKNVRGTYATTIHGTIDATGTLVADGAGNVTGGTETASDGTNVCAGTIAGSYTVSIIHGLCPSSPTTNTAAIVIVSEKRILSSGTDVGLSEAAA